MLATYINSKNIVLLNHARSEEFEVYILNVIYATSCEMVIFVTRCVVINRGEAEFDIHIV